MPRKPTTTKEMIIDAAFEIAKNEGWERINAQTVSRKLGCSTQPVMYQFDKIKDVKEAAYQKADKYHSAYIHNVKSGDPMKGIALNYIRFASEEKNLFRFLFQSNEFLCKSLGELIESEELQPILNTLAQKAQVSIEQAKTIFTTLFLFTHGYASMFANNSMEYDEEVISADLERIYIGAVYASKIE